jgi:hypothetical protein
MSVFALTILALLITVLAIIPCEIYSLISSKALTIGAKLGLIPAYLVMATIWVGVVWFIAHSFSGVLRKQP